MAKRLSRLGVVYSWRTKIVQLGNSAPVQVPTFCAGAQFSRVVFGRKLQQDIRSVLGDVAMQKQILRRLRQLGDYFAGEGAEVSRTKQVGLMLPVVRQWPGKRDHIAEATGKEIDPSIVR